ncbi:hypothetical protein GGH93_002500 [Coemansia aciculifera]|nr:hypothetical protein GGH93_002500 [Coemansia aciculifera]
MSDSILPADWPHSANGNSVSELLSGYSGTEIFTSATSSGGTQPLKFYLTSFNNKQAVVRAIKNNGGVSLQHKNIDQADIIIKPILTQDHSFGAVGVVCTPHLILKSLQAGRMLDTEDFELKEIESDESEESESEVSDEQLEETTPRAESRPQSQASADESESAGSSQQTVEMPERQQRQQQSRLSLTPASSAIGDIRYLYTDEELDPDDRIVDTMLSSRSRSIEDLVIRTTGSPGSQSNRSADISDNDFRVKSQLDAAARDPREMFDLALTDSPVDSLANSPASSANHSPQLGSSSTLGLQRVHEQEEYEGNNLVLRTPSPQPQPTKRLSSPTPQQTPSRSVFSRIKSLFLASQSINVSPSQSNSRKSPSFNGARLRSPIKPVALNTQYSQGSRASSSLSMEGTPERSASPELVMPPSMAPLSPIFAYIQSLEDVSPPMPQASTSSHLEASQPSQGIGLKLADPSDEENHDPSLLLGSRILRSESPELSSLPPASSKARLATRDGSKGKPSTPYPTLSFSEDGSAPPPPEPTAVWTGLGKRRRTSDRGSGYGHRPLPIIVDDSGDNEPTSPESSRQSLFLSQQRVPPVANKSQSVDSLLSTPTARRVRARVVPFSPSKRIRMSMLESPEATSANAASANTTLGAPPIPAPKAAAPNGSGHTGVAAMSVAAELDRLAEVSTMSHMATSPRANGLLSSSQLPSLASTSGITDATTADSAVDHGTQANPASDRPRVTTMPTDTTLSTVPTPVLGSPSLHDVDTHGPEVVAVSPSSEPLVISGLFANHGTAAGLRIGIPCGEPEPASENDDGEANSAMPITASAKPMRASSGSFVALEGDEIAPSALDVSESQRVPESPSHHSDDSGDVSDDDIADNDAENDAENDVENDADDDASDAEGAKGTSDVGQTDATSTQALNGELASNTHNTPEPSADPAVIQEEEEEPRHRHELLNNSNSVEDEDAFWRIEDVEEPLKLDSERTPRNEPCQGRTWPATSQTFKSRARMINSNARHTPEGISKSQPRATRSRRASTARIVSMCQRLLTLHKLGDNVNRLGLQLGDSLLNSRTLLGSDASSASRLASHDFSNAPSPARRAQFSGAMRVFGDNAPEMNDLERLAYLRKLKGLMAGTSLTPKQAMATLYRCTGDWVIARKLIVSGEAAVPSGRVWSAEDDQALQQGMDLDKMEELRQQKGNVEVYRRLQFLNTFHGPKE